METLKLLSKLKLEIAFAIGGILFLFLSAFKVGDIKKFDIDPRPTLSISGIFFGLLLIVLAIATAYLLPRLTTEKLSTVSEPNDSDPASLSIPKLGDSDGIWRLELAKAKIQIRFGRIEEVSDRRPNAMIALPANEFFDDECIADSSSSLGAYFNHHFQITERVLREQIEQEIASRNLKGEPVFKEFRKTQTSYGVGTTLFFRSLLSHKMPICLSSVTTVRAGEGLKSNVKFIVDAATSIIQCANDHRISKIYIPLIGAGHGGVSKELSLLALLLTFVESTKSNSNIKEYNIIAFKKNAESQPEVSIEAINKMTAFFKSSR